MNRTDSNTVHHTHFDVCSPISPDDPRQFFFVRNSRLPVGTFPRGRRIDPDAFVFAAVAILLALLLIATKAL